MPSLSQTSQAVQDWLWDVLSLRTILHTALFAQFLRGSTPCALEIPLLTRFNPSLTYCLPAAYAQQNSAVYSKKSAHVILPIFLTDWAPKPGLGNETDWIAVLSGIITFIFSWVFLMPLAVIISGVWLSQCMELRVRSRILFRLVIPPFLPRGVSPILQVEAHNAEAVLGFTGFIILFLTGFIHGPYGYALVRTQLGIDPGQFNSVGIISSFVEVGLSVILYFLSGKKDRSRDDLSKDLERLHKVASRKEPKEESPKESEEESQ